MSELFSGMPEYAPCRDRDTYWRCCKLLATEVLTRWGRSNDPISPGWENWQLFCDIAGIEDSAQFAEDVLRLRRERTQYNFSTWGDEDDETALGLD